MQKIEINTYLPSSTCPCAMLVMVGLELLMLPTPRNLCLSGGFALWGQLSRPFLNTLDLPK